MTDSLREEFTTLFLERYNKVKNGPPIITLEDIPHSLEYESSAQVYRPAVHIGQRKLFISELQLFTYYTGDEPEHIICVYAGAAPSNHTGFLAKLFPHIKFVLVDPNKFDIFGAEPVVLHTAGDPEIDDARAEQLISVAVTGDKQIYIINDLFTMELSRAISKIVNNERLYFISDIRTNVSDGASSPDAIDILWNLSQQYNWMKVMRPRYSMLKFRHPFYNEDPGIFEKKSREPPYIHDFELSREGGIDFVENFKTRRLVYWDGIVNIQAFPGRSSTETRLVTRGDELKDWGTPDNYDNKLFYYNLIERMYCHHYNPNSAPDLGFDHCNDCAIENDAWTAYIEKFPNIAARYGPNVRDFVKKLSANTHRSLIRESHGRLFDNMYPLGALIKAARDRAADGEKVILMFPPPQQPARKV